jgi:hypothetical protein
VVGSHAKLVTAVVLPWGAGWRVDHLDAQSCPTQHVSPANAQGDENSGLPQAFNGRYPENQSVKIHEPVLVLVAGHDAFLTLPKARTLPLAGFTPQ